MHDSVKVLGGKHSVYSGSVGYIELIQCGALAGDLLDTVYDLRRAVVKVIGDNYIIARVEHFYGGMAAYIARAACQ